MKLDAFIGKLVSLVSRHINSAVGTPYNASTTEPVEVRSCSRSQPPSSQG